ncbi:MAG: D-alanyl-D-alanine carboxypeptidase [Clostridiales bacterium]|nr:D-alanyl-D-alanine carboxypeptidase [Clostridiales bacterium]
MKKKLGIVGFVSTAVSLCCICAGSVFQKTVKVDAKEMPFCVQNCAETQENKGKKDHLNLRAKSAYVMDFGTETPIYSQNEKSRLPIASMCKIMTLLLSFEAIDEGILDINEEIVVSERAASMGGSQVFLEANAKYSVNELIKSIVVCSANDSCVAMAERIAGSEDVFVERMNEKAKEIGANDTLFANCTGLPKEPQYSCAKDVAIILKNLLKHEDYYTFSKVWMDNFQHPKGRHTEITNTNKLVRFYDGCDGGKTGFTNEAGFCLAATAKRGDMRIISVVIGEESSQNRFDDVRTTFDYAFANYAVTPVIEQEKPLEQTVMVSGGKQKFLRVYPKDTYYAFSRRGEKGNITLETRLFNVKAPIAKDQQVGEMIVYNNGVEAQKIPLFAYEKVEKANFFDCIQDVAKDWNAR